MFLPPWPVAGGARCMLARLGSASCRVLGSSVHHLGAAARGTRLAASRPHQHLAAAAAASSATQQQQQQQQLAAAQPCATMAADSPRAAEQKQKKQRKQPDAANRRPARLWRERPSYRCPACGQQCFKVPNFGVHILRCCPDVAPPEEWRAMLQAAESQQGEEQQPAAQAGGQPAEQQQQDGQPQADGQQRAVVKDSGADGGGQEQTQWKLHPADAAIRAWLAQAEQREAQQRRRAVSLLRLLCVLLLLELLGCGPLSLSLSLCQVLCGPASSSMHAGGCTLLCQPPALCSAGLRSTLCLFKLLRAGCPSAADRDCVPSAGCGGAAAAAGPTRSCRRTGPAAAARRGAAAGAGC